MAIDQSYVQVSPAHVKFEVESENAENDDSWSANSDVFHLNHGAAQSLRCFPTIKICSHQRDFELSAEVGYKKCLECMRLLGTKSIS